MKSIALILSAWVALSNPCSADPTVINQAVGPMPKSFDGPTPGGLVVYSKTERNPDQEETGAGDIVYYYPHSGYEILSVTGKHLQKITNHIGDHDETPQSVSLPAGKYKIRALSEKDGVLLIPVVIKTGRTTVLNLDHSGDYKNMSDKETKLVKSHWENGLD
jgi:hypothetical protein